MVLQSDPGHDNDGSPACSGSPTELIGSSGEFGISKSQYKNRAQCGWKIRVESGKVIKGSVPPVFIFSFYCANLTKQIRTILIIIAVLSFNSPRDHWNSQISSSDNSHKQLIRQKHCISPTKHASLKLSWAVAAIKHI